LSKDTYLQLVVAGADEKEGLTGPETHPLDVSGLETNQSIMREQICDTEGY